ncbi:grpE protein homolog 2, mitochondrial [Physcomitrium patens]|uniref:GrpE protein homolog n=1 Tax=Physcomitrium patens TaxID=3218 RepID=A9T4B5_PHYPA|nr:grpE protein homolog 2, mitochondrial-like [Physcomitrium patens]PNR30233.1 hypothetical protein PHYPA_026549 [Physcomitrium patens]|eukprot:XP_024360126.1 grpE protein homolog 2, mitochondrial-like [Physcomitrella patens]
MSSSKHARLLFKAFQKPPQIRCFRAPSSSAPINEKSVFSTKLSGTEFLSPLSKRWTAFSLHRAVPQVSSISNLNSFTHFSSAASPDVSDKTGSPEYSAAEPSRTSTAEGTSESVQHAERSNDIKADDLARMVAERDALLQEKDKTIKELQDKVLRGYAEVENVMARARREAESTRKFALQGFAKGLLDVADNLGRATGAVPENLRKLDSTLEDSSGAAKVLITLLQGVEMTEKQLQQVFRQNGLEKFESEGKEFDPNYHSAMFELEDETKTPGTVAIVTKVGYLLHDRVIRPAEVGVIKAKE